MARKRQTYSIDQSPFYKLTTKRRLADVLDLSRRELMALAEMEGPYREFEAPKKDGGTRIVEDPPYALKKVQKRIARHLSRIKPTEYLFCPVKGRSYVSNAARHQGNRVIRCMDVRKYFPSTPAWKVCRFFSVVMKCEGDVAELLTKLATYKGHLPTGSPLSPIMAYFAHFEMWERIAAICARHGWTLTVYIDDVTISGKQVRARDVWEVKAAIHAGGLRYHKGKERLYVDTPAEVTGVIISKQGLRAPNRQLLKMRQTKRQIALSDGAKQKKALVSTLQGLRRQMQQIEGTTE